MRAMKRLLFLALIGSALVFGCTGERGGGGQSAPAGDAGVTSEAGGPQAGASSRIDPKEAAAMVERGEAVLVDVREEREIVGGMAAPAIWIPTSDIGRDAPSWRDFVEAQPRERTLIFYCATGGRSQYAATLLADKGYRTANMGGFSGWQQAGLPVKVPQHPEPGH
jgi:rhodanese-related sulfurtransferase